MDLQHLLEGYILGFSVATTVGVSGVLCLQNMMTGQLSLGIASVFATAFADMSCGAIVALGLDFLHPFLAAYKSHLILFVGIFLCFMGIKKIFEKTEFVPIHKTSPHVLAAFGSVYFLSIVDPVSIADFATLLLGLSLDFSLVHKVFQFLIGLFLGSLSWWLFIFGLVVFLEKGLSVWAFKIMQYLIGSIILGLGIWTLSALLL